MDKTGLSAKDVNERITRNERELAANQAEIRNKVAALSAEKIDVMSRFLSAAAEAPADGLEAALKELRTVAEAVLEGDTGGDGSAAEWLLRDGVALLGRVLRRPEAGAAAPLEVGQQVAWLCHWLVASARSEGHRIEAQDPDFQGPNPLHHVLGHLRPAAPTCLQTLSILIEYTPQLPGRDEKILALAVTAAELAEFATRGPALAGCEALLLRFLHLCRQRLQATSAADLRPLTPESAQPAAGTAAAAATAAGSSPGAAGRGAAGGWDTALGCAALALADLVLKGSGGDSSITDAAFDASLAAAYALLGHRLHARADSVRIDLVVAEAIASPLQFGAAYRDQQQPYLLRVGSALQTAVADFEAASSSAAGSSASSRAGERCSELADRLYKLAQPVEFMMALMVPNMDGLAAWPAWRPWCEAIASCLQRLTPLGAHARDPPHVKTGQEVYRAAVKLLLAADQILRVPTEGGMEALERPPLPALLPSVAAACRVSPAVFGFPLKRFADVRAGVAEVACRAIAMAAFPQPCSCPNPSRPNTSAPAQPSPQLLRSACAAITTLLRMVAEGPGCGVWHQSGQQQQQQPQQQLQQRQAAAPGSSTPPWHLLQQLSMFVCLLQKAPSEALDASEAAAALVAALAPPPATQRIQRQRQRLAVGAAEPIFDACAALVMLLTGGASAAARPGFGDWPAVAAAIRQASVCEAPRVQQHIAATLQHVDRAQQDAGSSTGAAAGSPPRPNGRRTQPPAGGVPAGGVPHRTEESAEAAMRALLLDEEEAAAAAKRKASPKKVKKKQAAKCLAAAASSSSAPVDQGVSGRSDGHVPAAAAAGAGASMAAGAAAEVDAAGPVASRATQHWMLCPITQEVMRDPVLCEADGQTYERAAITAWLQQHGTSFTTRATPPTRNLIPNHALRSIIQAAGL